MPKRQQSPKLNPASLNAVADWNVNKALFLLREDAREKNHDRSASLQRDAGRHLRQSDNLRRSAWLIEHQR